MLQIDKRKQKWMILFLVWLGVFMTTYAQYQLSALSTSFMATFGFTSTQYSSIYTAPNWVSVALGIFVGAISDKLGVRKMVLIAGILCVIGTVIRVFSTTFVMFFITGLLTGFVAAVISCNRAKILGNWFTREEMGLAMGICMTVAPVSSTIGVGTTSLLPSMQVAFSIVAVIAVIFLVIWVLFGKERPDDVPVPKAQSMWTYVSSCVKNKWVWLLAIAGYIVLTAQVTTMAFISAAIQSRGYDAVAAGGMATAVTIGCGAGSIITPVIIRKLGRYKPVLAVYSVIGAASLYFGWQLSNEIAMYAVLFVAGIVLASLLTLLFTFPIFLVGQEKVSSATGIVTTIELLGGATGLTYIVMPLAGTDFHKIYGIAAIFLALSGFLMFLLPEFGWKANQKSNL